MSEFKTRLVIERDELKTKIERLEVAFDGDTFLDTVGTTQYNLLSVQLKAMRTYLECLNCRLEDLDEI